MSVKLHPIKKQSPYSKIDLNSLKIQLFDYWYAVKHALLLSAMVARFVLRYAYVIFRERVLEAPLAAEQLRALNVKTAHQYVALAMKLKGGTIKLGQFLSSRADVVPKELVEILRQLQDQVEPAPFYYVQQVIESQFEMPLDALFASFETQALAAASFGQVHRATLQDGQQVVVKVLHRDIERSVAIDLAIFRVAVFFFARFFPKFHIDRIYDEIADTTRDELDYEREADNAERVRRNLIEDKRIRVPQIYRDYCRTKVLTLEDISGLRVDDRALILAHGGNPTDVLRAIIGAYCKQIYVDAFFQSDPHPGNLFFYPQTAGQGPLIGIIDFGQAKEIPEQIHRNLRRAVLAVLQKDAESFMQAFVDLGIIESADIATIRRIVLQLASQVKQGTTAEVMKIDYEKLAAEIMQALRDLDALSIPNDLVLYARTLGLLHGLAFKLDPHLSIFEVAAPYILKFAFE